MTYSVAGDEKAWNAGIRMSKRHMRGSLAGRGRAVHRAVPEAPQQTQTSVAGWGALPADNNLVVVNFLLRLLLYGAAAGRFP